MNKIITFVACLIATALLQSQTTIFVKPDGTGDGTTWANACSLESAVVSASLNDRTEIWVQKGTYYPSKMLIIPDSVKIYGGFAGTETLFSQRLVAANPVIVDGQQKVGSIFRLENSAELNGFIIQNGNANGDSQKNGGGVWADENSVIANCVITHNTAALNGGGVYAKGKVEMINSTVKGNTANGSGNDMFGNCLMMSSEQSDISSGMDIAGCNPHIPDFGEVSFKTQTTVSVTADDVTLTWSDAVMAEGCNKTIYYGGALGSYYSDCRTNSDRSLYGDLFSWCAVARFAHVLCPAPWRVPTKEDFAHLDKAMGGNGDGSGPSPDGTPGTDSWGKYYYNNTVRNNYLNTWSNGFYGGICGTTGTLTSQGTHAYFWAQSEHSPERGFLSHLHSSEYIRPQEYNYKSLGFTLRCVK